MSNLPDQTTFLSPFAGPVVAVSQDQAIKQVLDIINPKILPTKPSKK